MKTSKRFTVLSLALILCFVAGGPLIPGKSGPLSYAAGKSEDVPFIPLLIGYFEVTWTLNTKGYRSYAHIVLKGRYEVYPKRSGGIRDGRGLCKEFLSTTYKGGGIVKAVGANSVGDPAEFGDARSPTGSHGMVCRMRDGSIEIRLGGPGVKALNMAAEEALGCGDTIGSWPVMRMSPAAFRDLASAKTMETIKWESPAATPELREAAPGCEEGSAKIELYGTLPKIVLAETCKEYRGVVTAPPKGEALKRCKGGEFDGFRVEDPPFHEPY